MEELSERQITCLVGLVEDRLVALSRELGVNPRTVRRWAAGATPVPPPVAACLRLMTFLEELEWLGEWRKLIAEELRSGWYGGSPDRRW